MAKLKGQCLVSFKVWKWAVAVFDKSGNLVDWDSAIVENLANLIAEKFRQEYNGKGYMVYKVGVTEVWET